MNASIREAQAVVAEHKAAEEAETQARVAVLRQAEADRRRFTADELSGSRFVKDEFGWHTVVRVNAKTVTVRTAYSWDDRIRIDRVHDFHT